MPAVRPEQWGGGGDSRRMGGVPSARTSAGDRGSVQTGNPASFTGEGSRDDVAGSRATTGDAVGPRDRQCGAPLRSLARRRGARSVPGTHGQGTVRLQPQPWGNVPRALRPSSRSRMQPLPPPPQDRRRGLSAPPTLSLHPPVPPSDKRRRPPAPAARTRTRSLPAARAARETHRGTVGGRGEKPGRSLETRTRQTAELDVPAGTLAPRPRRSPWGPRADRGGEFAP